MAGRWASPSCHGQVHPDPTLAAAPGADGDDRIRRCARHRIARHDRAPGFIQGRSKVCAPIAARALITQADFSRRFVAAPVGARHVDNTCVGIGYSPDRGSETPADRTGARMTAIQHAAEVMADEPTRIHRAVARGQTLRGPHGQAIMLVLTHALARVPLPRSRGGYRSIRTGRCAVN